MSAVLMILRLGALQKRLSASQTLIKPYLPLPGQAGGAARRHVRSAANRRVPTPAGRRAVPQRRHAANLLDPRRAQRRTLGTPPTLHALCFFFQSWLLLSHVVARHSWARAPAVAYCDPMLSWRKNTPYPTPAVHRRRIGGVKGF